jgi:hypothetical protein
MTLQTRTAGDHQPVRDAAVYMLRLPSRAPSSIQMPDLVAEFQLATVDAVNALNKQTIDALSLILQCACSTDTHLLTIASLVVFRLLNGYAQVAYVLAVAYDIEYDGEDSSRVAAHLVLGELHLVQCLVNQLSSRIRDCVPGKPDKVGFLDRSPSPTKASDPTSTFFLPLLDQLEPELRARTRSLSSDIIASLHYCSGINMKFDFVLEYYKHFNRIECILQPQCSRPFVLEDWLHIPHDNLDRIALQNPVHPILDHRKLVLIESILLLDDTGDNGLPRQKRQISIRVLVAHQPRSIADSSHTLLLPRQMALQHTHYAIDLADIAIHGTRHLFLVELFEPRCLSVVWALTAGLKEQPLPCELRFVGTGWETNSMVLVVALHEVFDNSAGFPQRKVGVGVMNGGDAAVGIDGQVRGFFDRREGNECDFVRDIELGEDNGYFGGVGTAFSPDFDRLERGHDCT